MKKNAAAPLPLCRNARSEDEGIGRQAFNNKIYGKAVIE